ncbi:Glutathione peroxidase 2 [Liparis tanakae]|uniref:glutathione peroxidase n=1 Tax=Liparis tanakae TaxID=230148 RepID=A0A4Z2JBR9_9TELE|nr:Glutathione peroxidase 2 [Liparis tanakae]
MTFIAKTFYDLKATTLEGDSVDFNVFRGRVVLIENENCSNGEILNSLQHVRPGGGFQPSFTIFEKCDVNGTRTHPVFAYLKDKLPYPDDDSTSLMQDPKFLVWSPINRTDVSWNFEKFLIGPEGEPFKRYSKMFPTIDIEPDIQRLMYSLCFESRVSTVATVTFALPDEGFSRDSGAERREREREGERGGERLPE